MSAHILVVDDDPLHREYLMVLLEAHGYRVTEAENGRRALAALEQASVDLVLLDIMMPGLDGAEVCQRIRESPVHAELPIVIITIRTDEQARQHAFEVGADDFLTKPVDHLRLLETVQGLLARASGSPALLHGRMLHTLRALRSHCTSLLHTLEARVVARLPPSTAELQQLRTALRSIEREIASLERSAALAVDGD